MTPIIYLRLRRVGLRNAWHLSGMPAFTMTVLKYLGIVAVAVALWLFNAQQVTAAGVAADQRVAVQLAGQTAEIEQLRAIVAACVGEKFGTLKIGDEWFICGINSIGRM